MSHKLSVREKQEAEILQASCQIHADDTDFWYRFIPRADCSWYEGLRAVGMEDL